MHSSLSTMEAGSFWRMEVMKRPEVVWVPHPAVRHCDPADGGSEARLATSRTFGHYFLDTTKEAKP